MTSHLLVESEHIRIAHLLLEIAITFGQLIFVRARVDNVTICGCRCIASDISASWVGAHQFERASRLQIIITQSIPVRFVFRRFMIIKEHGTVRHTVFEKWTFFHTEEVFSDDNDGEENHAANRETRCVTKELDTLGNWV